MYKKVICFIFLALLICWSALYPSGPFEATASEYVSGGLGGAGIVSLTGARSIFYNPAGLSAPGKMTLYTQWAQRWGLTNMGNGILGVHYGTDIGEFGLGYHSWGDKELYRELNLALAYSNNFLAGLYTGMRLNYYKLELGERYGSASQMGLDIGANYFFNEEIAMGLMVTNLNRPKINDSSIPSRLYFAAAFFPAKWTKFEVNFEIEEDKPVSVKMGEELIILEDFHLKAGVSGNPINFHLGLSYEYSYFDIGWSYFTHPDLSDTHSLSLATKF